VSGIAHDYGNILAVVMNYLSLATRRVDDPATVELLDLAERATDRAARLTRQLHELGDCGRLRAEPLPVDELVRAAAAQIGESLGPACTLRVDVEGEPLVAMASRSGMEIALRHLVQNACDAMPEGGAVTIAARPLAGGDATTAVVEVRVSDTGTGMPDEVAARALEPRFSTRPKGQAAGLGLTIVDRVARRLGAELVVESAEGSGTTVRLLLREGGADA
jgi:signal transduction histidine kinase